MRIVVIASLLMLASLSVLPIHAQNDCGVVDGIGFPVDTGDFILAQDYAVASQRHQGRYHTGEDWHAGRDNSVGRAVRAAARGRVTYSSANGWGRDGGVIILEHTFPDGEVYYTLYGHITQSQSTQFPPRLACVTQGEIIGVIADVRPAPHLHFEVRESGGTNGSIPGAGYSLNTPKDEGIQNPSKFIVNQQTWLSLWYDWHLMIGNASTLDERGPLAPPVVLNDASLLYLDGAGRTLRRATSDGRVLWRLRLDTPAVAIRAWQGRSLLILSDGTMGFVDVETGALGDSWRIEVTFTGAPHEIGDELLFPAPDDRLIRIGSDRRSVTAIYNDVPPAQRTHILLDGRFAILTGSNEFRYYAADGTLINTAQLRAAASFATSWEGDLLVYTRGGLWRVDRNGQWSLYVESAPVGGDNAALLTTQERLYLYTGTRLIAYNRDLMQVWQASIPPTSGQVGLSQLGDILMLTSNAGDILLVNGGGSFCNQVRIYGQSSADQWHALGQDNRLRIAIADQLLALDWQTFSRPCTA